MKHNSLGGLDVSRIGLGCMSMSGYYNIGAGSDAESIRTTHRRSTWASPTSTPPRSYGPFTNEELVGRPSGPPRPGGVGGRNSASSPTPVVAPGCSTAARRTSAPRSRAR